ncbi:MAG UNVERIFIED_CONTAM: hypothetical protein LVR18_49260 [Planctomycetaceae bacterium]
MVRGDGPESDIVISSRVRLARNIAGFPFISRASADIRHQLVQLAHEALNSQASLPAASSTWKLSVRSTASS